MLQYTQCGWSCLWLVIYGHCEHWKGQNPPIISPKIQVNSIHTLDSFHPCMAVFTRLLGDKCWVNFTLQMSGFAQLSAGHRWAEFTRSTVENVGHLLGDKISFCNVDSAFILSENKACINLPLLVFWVNFAWL